MFVVEFKWVLDGSELLDGDIKVLSIFIRIARLENDQPWLFGKELMPSTLSLPLVAGVCTGSAAMSALVGCRHRHREGQPLC